jgi:teichuronic acid biosynthesis glycosyltransferase TuaG
LLIYRDDPQNSIRAFCLPYWDLKANVLKSFISWAENESVDKVNRKHLGMAKKLLLYVYIKKLLNNLMGR